MHRDCCDELHTLPSAMQKRTHVQAYNTRAQKGTGRQRHTEACCDDLGFSPFVFRNSAPSKKGVAQISHAGACTNTPTPLMIMCLSCTETHYREQKQETYNPHNLPFSSLHPQQTSLFPSSFHGSFFIFSSFSLHDISFHFLA